MNNSVFGVAPLPLIVLDQNVLRDGAIIDRVKNRCIGQGLKMLLPDVALYEMFKNNPYRTSRDSLMTVARYPDLVCSGRLLGDLMELETQEGQPHIEVMDELATPYYRSILRALYACDDALLNDSLARLKDFLPEEIAKRNDHVGNKRRFVDLIESWKSNLEPKDLKRARTHDEALLECLLADLPTVRTCKESLEDVGCSEEGARNLAIVPSCYSYYIYTLMALALDWTVLDGYSGRAAEDFTNDVDDAEYITLSLFCTDLVSKDGRANRVRRRVLRALERRAVLFKNLASPDWHGRIEEDAFDLWKKKGATHGHNVDDWLSAEKALIQRVLETANPES